MFGPMASAMVSSSSTRPIGAVTVTGWSKTMPVPNVDFAVGVPNVAGAAAVATGARPASKAIPSSSGATRRAGPSRREPIMAPMPDPPSG